MIGGSRTAGALRVPPPLAAVVSRLPQWPHSAMLAAGLNLLLRPLLIEDARTALRGRVVLIGIADTGIDCRVRLAALGFVPVLARGAPDVSIRASVYDYWLLARRVEDADSLFFARRLIMEGDTELGLVVKNALDAVEWSPASLLAALAHPFSAPRA